MKGRLRDDRGIATIEFAILAPVLMLILLGIIQIGIYIYTTVDVRQATREGGRQLTLLRNDSSAAAEVKTKVAAALGGEVKQSNVAVTFSTPPPWSPGATVTMTVTYPDALSVMGIKITSGPIKDTAQVTVE
ncbi:MAG TPA: TadE/TadG family type IV pilus assembly protein [Solirubrobacteraceae bacterium]|jgi:Flp pilus assembly protein TadG